MANNKKKTTISLLCLMNILNKIKEISAKFTMNDFKINMSYHSNKDYYTIDLVFSYCNSEYKDCIVIYNEVSDDFSEKEILEELDKIYKRACLIKENF
jgi:hypothetical protein